MAIYDADGNAIEDADIVPKADHDKIVAEAEALKAKTAEQEAELSKLRDKSANFDKFRSLSAEEKKKIVDKMSDAERANHERLEALEAEIAAGRQERQEILLGSVAGGNEELAKLVKEAAAELETARGAPKTALEARTLYADAKAIVESREKRKINPLNATNFPSTDATAFFPKKKKENHADTKEGKELAEMLGMVTEEKAA